MHGLIIAYAAGRPPKIKITSFLFKQYEGEITLTVRGKKVSTIYDDMAGIYHTTVTGC